MIWGEKLKQCNLFSSIHVHLSWGLEAQTNTLVVTWDLFLGFLATISCQNTLFVLEYGGLFLV